MRALRLVPVLAFLAAPVAAQSPSSSSAAEPPPGRTFFHGMAHHGKWLTAAAAVGFTVLGAVEHAHSQDRFDALLALCKANNAQCMQGSDGRYVDVGAERLYQESLYYDRRARRRILIGQGALLVTALFFIVDASHGGGKPADIPFEPAVAFRPDGTGAQLGFRVAF